MAGRSRGARLGGGLLPRALLLVMAAAAAVQHASAEPECSVVISLKAPPADPFVDQYLNLAEVELYDNADNKITIPALDFTISSVKPVYPSENCNDGIKTADLNGNDVIDPGEGAACSTNANDPYPNITIAFPCSPGLKKVLVYNVGNFGNAQRITQFKLEAFGIGGISKKVYDFNEGTPNKEYTIDEIDIAGGSVVADPHLKGFNGAEYAFCDPEHGTGATCNGYVIALLSEVAHLLNARITQLAGPDTWPFAGFWMTALGFRWADVLSVEVEMATDVVYIVKPAAERGDGAARAEVPANWAGVFTSAKINGKDVAASIGSGDTLDVGVGDAAASVHFPKGRHPGDPTDGPVMVIATPAMQVTVYLETEDITHLDFSVSLITRRITAMHGMLGQSLHWAPGAPAAVEGDDDMLYAVAGGDLLGADFKYSLFGSADAATVKNARTHRALLQLPSMDAGNLLTAGSPAAVRLFIAKGDA